MIGINNIVINSDKIFVISDKVILMYSLKLKVGGSLIPSSCTLCDASVTGSDKICGMINGYDHGLCVLLSSKFKIGYNQLNRTYLHKEGRYEFSLYLSRLLGSYL